MDRNSKDALLFVGTYTSGESKSRGIYIYKFDINNGSLVPHRVVGGVEDPSFLALNKRRTHLYAVNETVKYQGQESGAVSSFAIDEKSGDLVFLNKQPSLGAAPCHISVSDSGKFVLVANYLGGNLTVLPVNTDGSLAPPTESRRHSGSGPNKERQEGPHAHSVILDRNNRFAFVNDLGIDRIVIYEFDAATGKLAPNPPQPFYQARAGAGPRHFKFHPAGRYAFSINELDQTITSFAYDEKKGTLKEIQTVSTIPPGFSGQNTCADLHVSPDGAFLYGSNRGHDSIVVYGVDQTTGRLSLIEHVSTQGRTPRNFSIDPTGSFLLVANQRSDNIATFRVDRKTGRLSATGKTEAVPAPVCLKFL